MWLLMTILLVTFGTFSAAQERGQDSATAQRVEMKKLEPWVGDWKGTGWMMTGPGARKESVVTEKVTSKLGGMVFLIEGLGIAKSAEGSEQVVHNALAVLSYDDRAKLYRFRTHEMNGRAIESELKMIEGGMQWGFREPQRNSNVRFTVKMDGKTWHEVGEISLDGTNWIKFMEMTLQKQGAKTTRK